MSRVLLAQAEALLDLQRPEQALALLGGLGDDPDAGELRVRALSALGRDREALVLVDALLGQAPDDAELHRLRAFCLAATGRARAAVLAAREARRLDPDGAGALSAVVALALEAERPGEAREAALHLLAVHPDLSLAHYLYGEVALKTGDTATAEQAARHVLATDPQDTAALGLLADVQDCTSRSREAVGTMWAAARADPTDVSAPHRIARAGAGRWVAGTVAVVLYGTLRVSVLLAHGEYRPTPLLVAGLLYGAALVGAVLLLARAALTGRDLPRTTRRALRGERVGLVVPVLVAAGLAGGLLLPWALRTAGELPGSTATAVVLALGLVGAVGGGLARLRLGPRALVGVARQTVALLREDAQHRLGPDDDPSPWAAPRVRPAAVEPALRVRLAWSALRAAVTAGPLCTTALLAAGPGWAVAWLVPASLVSAVAFDGAAPRRPAVVLVDADGRRARPLTRLRRGLLRPLLLPLAAVDLVRALPVRGALPVRLPHDRLTGCRVVVAERTSRG